MISSRTITAIMACDDNGLIGKGRGLPNWGCPEDMQHFCDTTRGQTVIMGWHTYACFPRSLLPERNCIVVSHDDHPPRQGVAFVTSVDGLVGVIRDVPATHGLFFVGGADLAAQLIDRHVIDTFILSHIHGVFTGDCSLPPRTLHTIRSWPVASIRPQTGFTIYHHANPQPSDLC